MSKLIPALAKNVGLSKTDTKMLEFVSFPNGINHAGLLYNQAKGFYSIFRASFGYGYETILGHDIPKLSFLGPCIVNYHFSVELMIKSLISLKGLIPDKTHNLIELLKVAIPHYPQLVKIYDTLELKLLLQEISKIGIRYAEGTTCLRHNICETKKPPQELSEAMEYIFLTLKESFENSR